MKRLISYLFSTLSLALVFSFFTISRIDTIDFTAWIYLIFSSLSHASMIMLIPLILSFIPYALCKKESNVPFWTMIGLTALLFVIVFADANVYDLYRFHINGIVLSMLFSAGSKDIFTFEGPMVLTVVLKIAAIITFFVVMGWSIIKIESKVKLKILPIVLTLFGITLVAQGLNVYAQAVRHSICIECCENLPHYYPLTANTKLAKMGLIDASKRPQMNLSSGKIKYPLVDANFVKPDTLMNFVWLMIDSWNVRSFDSITSPNIYQFSKRCEIYENHKSSSNGTISSVFGLYTGISDYYREDFEFSDCSPLLIERLQNLDYDIQFYPSASLDNPPIVRTLFAKIKNLRHNTGIGDSYMNDCGLTKDCNVYLDSAIKRDQPFFVWCFYDLPHAMIQPDGVKKHFEPAWNSANYTALNNDLDPTEFWNLYRNNVYLVDSMINTVLNTLEKTGALKNTVVMITGDHSQEFNENHKNYWGHNGNFTNAQIQVPMMIYYPELENPCRYSHQTTHYDVAYTMLYKFLGLTSPASDICMGHLMNEPSDAQYFISGSKQNFALVSDSFIVEKRPGGNIKVTDKNLNTVDESKVDFAVISKELTDLNRFYK